MKISTIALLALLSATQASFAGTTGPTEGEVKAIEAKADEEGKEVAAPIADAETTTEAPAESK